MAYVQKSILFSFYKLYDYLEVNLIFGHNFS